MEGWMKGECSKMIKGARDRARDKEKAKVERERNVKGWKDRGEGRGW